MQKDKTIGTAGTAETKGEEQVTVSFKCTKSEKSLLLQRATDEANTSLSDYLRYKALEEAPKNIQPDQPEQKSEVITDEEKEAYERLIGRLRNENYDLKFELHTYKNIKLGESDKDSKINALTSELETAKANSIENVDFVKDFLDWSKSDLGKKTISAYLEDENIDASKISDRQLIIAVIDMGVDHMLPEKKIKTQSVHLKWAFDKYPENQEPVKQ